MSCWKWCVNISGLNLIRFLSQTVIDNCYCAQSDVTITHSVAVRFIQWSACLRKGLTWKTELVLTLIHCPWQLFAHLLAQRKQWMLFSVCLGFILLNQFIFCYYIYMNAYIIYITKSSDTLIVWELKISFLFSPNAPL